MYVSKALVISGLCTLIRSCPFFTLSSRRVRMSTTRPLASEMTGTSRLISGLTDPVTFNCAGASTRSAVINENCSGFSTVTRPVLLVSVTFAGGAAPSAGLNFFSHATGRRHTARYPAVVKKRLLVLIGWSFPHDLWNGAGICYRNGPFVVTRLLNAPTGCPVIQQQAANEKITKLRIWRDEVTWCLS